MGNTTNNNQNQSSDGLYLENLQFNPELKKSWLNFFIANFRVVVLLLLLITTWGIYAFSSLPRESNPEVKIPIAAVITTYPGASPADIEELVTKKLETGIAGLKNLKKISSSSRNSVSSITVEFNAKADLDDSLRKLRDQVNNDKKNLPSEAKDPIVKEISLDDTPIWSISLSGPYDDFTMRKIGEDLQDEFEKIPGVREVYLSGGDETEFEVAYNPEKLTLFNISPDQVNQIIKGTNLAIPAGSFDGREFVYPIRTDSRFYTAEKLAETPLMHTDAGGLVLLKDVATVSEKAIKKTTYSRLSNQGQAPQSSISLSLIKKTGYSIVDTVTEAQQKLDATLATLPTGITANKTLDLGEQIDEDFSRLTHDFIVTILLVFFVLFLIVGFKEALVAGLAVPLVFFITFGVMQVTGISLNFLSIFSLILALGLLVDDAIVVVSAAKQYLKTGKFTPEEAVLLVFKDYKMVLTTTTLTTVWAFLPLLATTGIIGEFIKSIPVTVSVTLISSLLIALVINHPLAAILERLRLTNQAFKLYIAILIGLDILLILTIHNFLLKLGVACLLSGLIFWLIRWYLKSGSKKLENNAQLMEAEWLDDELIKKKLREQGGHDNESFISRLMHGIVHFEKLLPIYEKYLNKLLATKKTRLTTLAITGAVFIVAISLPITGVIPSEFFPPSNSDLIYVNIEAPIGLKLQETDKVVKQVEEKLLKYPEIINFTTLVGGSNSGSDLSSGSTSSHLASITIKLNKKDQRKIKSYELSDVIRKDLASITDAKVTIATQSSGPPSGKAFEARILGEDLQQLDKIAQELKPILSEISGTINEDVSLKQSPADYTFTLDPSRLELYSLNSAYVGSTLRMAIAGSEITTVIRNTKEIKVIARFNADNIPTLEAIQNLQILNNKKQPVFIKDVAKIELKPSVDSITRIDQKRTVLLSSDVEATARPQAVVQEFQTKIGKNYKLPTGYTITYGGENEANTESVVSIIKAMAIAGLLIISTLIIQFNSFRKALITLVTIPLALIGVFFGMAVMGINLSFPGLIGILALFGIVVKNAIILVDKINLNLKSGIEFKAAIVDAGKSRLEAIFITSICTIFGIIPITLSDETWMALGSAVIFGLSLSSFFTLFIIPVLFMSVIGRKERF